ncbi:hypothetical protein [Gorillibacterium sp. CAU 1737]|uniref:hypothetical protein n=1 Tax=Gorillibacterium sp. CAU 1737 TaxID=3140362 RepID=UPI0032600FB1
MANPAHALRKFRTMTYSGQIDKCPACQQVIYKNRQHYVESKFTDEFYCDTSCCLVHNSTVDPEDDRYRIFEDERMTDTQIITILGVVSYG